jgi:hypothetical protein
MFVHCMKLNKRYESVRTTPKDAYKIHIIFAHPQAELSLLTTPKEVV